MKITAPGAIALYLFTTLPVLLGACKDTPVGPPPIVLPADTEQVVYSKHIGPIFLNSCGGAGCHLNGEHYRGMALDTWTAVMDGSDYGAVVIPYSSRKSHLFQHINTDTLLAPRVLPSMPLSRTPLTRPQLLAIKRWIDEGAKNDDGSVALGDPARPRVYVTAQSEDKVTVIDRQTARIARYVTVGERPDSSTPPEAPHNLTVSPDGNFLYVNLVSTGMVEKYDAHTFAKLGSCAVGKSPAQVICTRDGKTLYASNFDQSGQQQYVNRVDAATMTMTATIQVFGKAPHGIALSSDEKKLYALNALSDDISVIDLGTGDRVARIPVQPGAPASVDSSQFEPYQGTITPDGRTMFVSCRKAAQVRVIDLTTNTVLDSITVPARPLILNITPDGREVWVPCQVANSLSIISVATRQVTKTITGFSANSQPHAIAFAPDGKTAYLSCENQKGDLHHPTVGTTTIPGLVYVIDATTRVPMKLIEVGGFAAGIAVAP